MAFDSHRRMIGEGGQGTGGPYVLSKIRSVAWHARDEEGEVVRREIRAAAAKRGVPIYDADGTRLDPDG